MFCVKCGAPLPEETRFCPACGAPVAREKFASKIAGEKTTKHTVNTIQFRCRGCGSVMAINPDSPVLRCSVCGSNELIQEHKDVTVERIRCRAKQDELQTYKEIQQGWQHIREKEIEADSKEAAYRREAKEVRSYRRGFLFYVTIFLTVLFCFFCLIEIGSKRLLPSIISGLQIVLCITSISMGYKTVNIRRRVLRSILVLLAFLMIPVFFNTSNAAIDTQREVKAKKNQEELMAEIIEWPQTEITKMLPVPSSNVGEIYDSSDSRLSVWIYFTPREAYNEFVQGCMDKGFTVDAEQDDTSYRAFNQEGYLLSVYIQETDYQRMSITVDEPIKTDNLNWPGSKLVKTIPVPNSMIGEVLWERNDNFSVYVCNTSREEYDSYVNSCMERGYDFDYSRSDDTFRGADRNGNKLDVEYYGFNIMKLYVRSG